MKTKLLLSLVLFLNFCLLSSQVPQGFNYQAIARDPSTGDAIANATIDVKLGILSDTLTPVIVREELFSSVKTDRFGVFILVIGTGTYQAGSVTNFSDIDWTAKQLYLKIQVKLHTDVNWKYMGSAKLWSVPYSMVAGNLEGTVPLLSVKGNTTTMDSALFVVRNNTGQIVFAVYNEGVRIYVDDGVAKGATKGGFAIGSFDKTKGTSQTLFVVDPDSIRGYIAPNTGKAGKGGFAIGGFDPSKTVLGEEYLRVTRDSSRIYVLNPGKGVKGGFAIGGFDPTKGSAKTPFTSLTPDNYFLGEKSGINNTSGLYNSFFGYETGMNNATGSKNIFLGYQAGHTNKDGLDNIFIGNKAGYFNTLGFENICIGNEAGYSITGIGQENNCIGMESGYKITTGYYNCFFGTAAGYSNKEGNNNVYIGEEAGEYDSTGVNNVIVGAFAGWKGPSFSNSIIIGANAGKYSSGSNNIFIGNYAGFNEAGSNKLYIDNNMNDNNNAFIYGEFNNSILRFNSSVGIRINPTHLIDLSGGAYSDGTAWVNSSDKNIKENFENVDGVEILGLINKLPITRWNYKSDSFHVKHIGPVAQDFYSLFGLGNDDKSISSIDPSGIALVAIKELSRQNKFMRKEIESIKKENQQLRSELDELKTLVSTLVVNQTGQGNK